MTWPGTELTDIIESARTQGMDELASTGYSQLANLDVEHHRIRSAEHLLEESLPFTIEKEIPICSHWQTGVRSRLHLAQGRWSAALEDADQVLDDNGMPLATLWPLMVKALVPLRRGESVDVDQHFEAAWILAEQLDEPVRRLAALSALAERMWHTESADARVTAARRTRAAVLGCPARHCLGGGRPRGLAATPRPRVELLRPLAEPLRCRSPAGTTRRRRGGVAPASRSRRRWHGPTRPIRTHRIRGVELLDQLGAVATADRQRLALRRDGIAQVPPRPRVSTRANPGGLTNRQLDVAKLVARGFTNSEIAARLYISPKTTDHHVSAVLAKLQLPSRRAVMVQAHELGLG